VKLDVTRPRLDPQLGMQVALWYRAERTNLWTGQTIQGSR
jgi:hypothetical protein